MKKRIISFLLVLTLIMVLSTNCFADSKTDCSLSIDITFAKNLFFNKYDVDLFLDGQNIAHIDHGSSYISMLNTSSGAHTIMFCKTTDYSINYTNQISVDRDCIYKCTIHAEAKKIVLSDKEFKPISDDSVDESATFIGSETTQQAIPSKAPEMTSKPTATPKPTPSPTPNPTATPEIIPLEPIELPSPEENDNVDESDSLMLALSTPNLSSEGGRVTRSLPTDDDPLLSFARKLDGIDGLTFNKGSRNHSVYSIQALLSNLGYLTSSIDGDYGNLTKDAVTAFQKDEGLTETEYADVATQFLLVARSPKREVTQNAETMVVSSNDYAIILWMDGTLYVGSIESGDQLIEGTYIYPTGDYYAGSFKNGMRSGNGTAHFANGDVYVGQWTEDKMNGTGKYFFGGFYSPETYDGNWVNNKMDGKGTYTLFNGTMITGTWKNNKHISW